MSAARGARDAAAGRPGRGAGALRGVGWLLVGAGAVVLLYLVYTLLFTNLGTEAAQRDLLDRWQEEVGALGAAPSAASAPAAPVEQPPSDEADEPDDEPQPDEADEPEAIDPGSAIAVIEFRRPGSDDPPVHADPLFVVSGVTAADLTRGPGHYPSTALPGEVGNFAVAGHRTTYGAPFFHLDQLTEGDEIVVSDRAGDTHVYRFAEQRVVRPDEVGVLEPDVLGDGERVLTLTTCHPRFSQRQRLVVFATLAADGETDV